MPEIINPVDQLRAVYEDGDSQDPKRTDILIVEGVEMLRGLMVRQFQELFPSYNILAVADGREAVRKISQELQSSLAMVFADMPNESAAQRALDSLELLFALRKAKTEARLVSHGKMVPVIFTSAGISESEILNRDTATGRILAQALKGHQLDGFIEKPFTLDRLAAVLSDAIAKRAGLFEKIERAARERVLSDFIEYYNNLVKAWEVNLRSLMATATASTSEDLGYLLGGVESFKANLAKMSIDIDYQGLRKLIHDFNNSMTALISFSAFILEAEISGSTRGALTVFKAEVRRFQSDIGLINKASQGAISWASADQPKLTPEPEQVLRCPRGTRFCVIDDNENVIRVCERVIEDAAGKLTLSVSGQQGIQNMLDAHANGVEIDVFLLDHELGGESFGYQLIEAIRTCYPQALIIGHTGEADDLKKDPENPYRKAGIEVVGKRQWSAVSGVIRRKFNPGGDV